MARSLAALPTLIPVRSQNDPARGMAVALMVDDAGALSLVIHDFDSNGIRIVEAAAWTVEGSPLPHRIVVPAAGGPRP